MKKNATAFDEALKRMLLTGLIVLAGSPALAQDDEEADEDDGPPTIEEKTEEFEKADGLFPFYTDPENGDVYMEIAEDQIGDEFIAFSYTENGVLEAGHFRGAYRDQRVLRFDKHFDRLEAVEVNTAFYFDEDNALARAKDANISEGVLSALKIEARTQSDEGERYLVKANDLFLSQALHKVTPTPPPGAEPPEFSLGELAPDRTKFVDIRNYPANSDIIVDYVFSNPSQSGGNWFAPGSAITDNRSVTVKMQHSLIAMPDEGFTPRFDDYRVGYFFDQVTDLTSHDAVPYRDMITRWRLEKKDPDAEVSDPVKPITWWIENTTPHEYRDLIRDATLRWNSSFEKAGISNAIEVKVQPDDADWDAGDIRYNVLRWTSSPVPPFGGYGPSFTNPRTGEIIGADIMLEFTYLTNRMVVSDVFEGAGIAESAAWPAPEGGRSAMCAAAQHLHAEMQFASLALQAAGASDEELEELVRQELYLLILHEVGHTLGLNHNMKATMLFDPREVHDKSVTQGNTSGSVMDYHAVNLAPPGVEQGDYIDEKPGAYDDWAIQFGYTPDLDGAAREALLARSVEPELAFGNDADDMRAPGAGIDPRVNISDMSSDPVQYGVDRIALVNATLPKLIDKFDDEKSWQNLNRGYIFATTQHARQAQVISRQIGGVYVDRTPPGQDGVMDAPFTAVPKARQKAAMEALKAHVFAADAFDAPEELIRHLQTQRRGFNFFGGTEDPKIHTNVLSIQTSVLDHLLHPVVLQRMTDSSLYGNEYPPAEMIGDLTDAIFGGDLRGRPNAFRQNLQTAYLERLVAIVDDPAYDPMARAAALAGAENVRARLGLLEFGLSAETKAHRGQIKRILARLDA